MSDVLKNPFASKGSLDPFRVHTFYQAWTPFLQRVSLYPYIRCTQFQTILVGQALHFSITLHTPAPPLHWDQIALTFKKEYPQYECVFDVVENNTSMILMTVHEQSIGRSGCASVGLFLAFVLMLLLIGLTGVLVVERQRTHILPTRMAAWWLVHQPEWWSG